MSTRALTATAMAFRDQRRRPLVLILLVVIPAYVITKSVAETQATARQIELPGGIWITTTMKALHGPEMAKMSVAFVAALVGVFVMQSALQGDRRLVIAGFRPGETVLARLAVLTAASAIVVAVSTLVTALFFTPASWLVVIAALGLTGLIYAAIGALAGALLDKLPATYLILFGVMSDLGVVQSAMFHATPVHGAALLPGYGPSRVLLDGAYSHAFHASGPLLISLGWAAALAACVYLVLRRAVMPPSSKGRPVTTASRHIAHERAAPRALRERVSTLASSVVAAVLGIAPHVLHHAGPLAGTALLAGTGGALLFGAIGLLAAIPWLLRVHRRCGNWRIPSALLALFLAVFSISTFVLGPAISGGGTSKPTPSQTTAPNPSAGHDEHHQ
jgi:MFS family permease